MVEAFVRVSESVVDAGYHEMKSDESANDSVFSSYLWNRLLLPVCLLECRVAFPLREAAVHCQ